MPTREDFFRELLDSRPLPTSASFDAYAPDSFTVDKIELWREFPEFARSHGYTLRGLVIFGPVSPLWSYYVVVLLQDGEQVRVNEVVFPHARLVLKQTGLRSPRAARLWLAKLPTLLGVEEIEPDPDALERRLPANGYGDHRFDLLVVMPDEPTGVFISGVMSGDEDPPNRPALLKHLNELVSKLEPTYEHGDPVPGE